MCILIVEDELLIRMGAAVTLEDAGHEVLCAADGQEAVDLIQQHTGRFSALVTDYHMPGPLSGTDVVEYMRRDHPTIPAYIVSARTNVVGEAWRAAHQVTLLAKPYDPDDLVRLIQKDTGPGKGP